MYCVVWPNHQRVPAGVLPRRTVLTRGPRARCPRTPKPSSPAVAHLPAPPRSGPVPAVFQSLGVSIHGFCRGRRTDRTRKAAPASSKSLTPSCSGGSLGVKPPRLPGVRKRGSIRALLRPLLRRKLLQVRHRAPGRRLQHPGCGRRGERKGARAACIHTGGTCARW